MGDIPVSRQEYDEFIEACSRNIPESFGGDEPVEVTIVRYIRHLEAQQNARHVRQTIGTVAAGSRVTGMIINQ